MALGQVSKHTWFSKTKLTYMRLKDETRDFVVSRKVISLLSTPLTCIYITICNAGKGSIGAVPTF